ncbi:DUF1396 domain-containing protein [Spongiactinospora sp. TRM90649]|uniref:DUF1396 domain-containing protein n=1 Tax=Spongiactinospora sp. TRM90649 TaxID=3031114 RepID=UPI0023F78757|nr:DUF1396 domain-containing protein [Spongiactinospora sp. TRM90649]MDF5751564.1 DUF1396 domain-containing protein [Spongiactinospora sp. TRM90649]
MRRITLAIAAVGAASAVVLTGCGSTSPQLGSVKLAAAEAVAQSAQQAEAVSSYTVDAVADFSHPDGGAGKVQGRMVYQSKPQLAVDLTLDTVSFGQNNLPGGARAILVGDTAYIKLDALKSMTGVTKPWIKASVSDLDGQGRTEAQNALGRIQQFDLSAAVKLVTASKDVKSVGTESVGGVDTTHYSGTFPVEEAVKLLDPAHRDQASQSFGEVKNMKFDLWADAQSLPRKITMSGEADRGKFNATMMFKGYNEPVEITAPPASEVGEIPNRTQTN